MELWSNAAPWLLSIPPVLALLGAGLAAWRHQRRQAMQRQPRVKAELHAKVRQLLRHGAERSDVVLALEQLVRLYGYG
jgi:cytochrome c-type biogenesis protein CcmH/NrfF